MANNRTNKARKEAANTTTTTTTSKEQTTEAPKHTPKVVLRTYQEGDHEQLEYLFRSTSVPLVYESIRSKVWAPLSWVCWVVIYTVLMLAIPKLVTLGVGPLPDFLDTILRILITFFWGLASFAILFISSDRVEIQNRIDEALANDLKDPQLYYLNYTYDENGQKVRKAEKDQEPSHFWVLTLDDEVCGMIGLSCNAEDVYDQRTEMPVPWKQFTAAVLELFRLPVPRFLEKGSVPKEKYVFAHKQIPKTATITRLAVRGELQTSGFSTLLINRAITWASEHGINRVYAMTNECHMATEQILVYRHNFVIMKRYNLNFFGQYYKLFGCRVAEWMEKNGEKTRKIFQKSSK